MPGTKITLGYKPAGDPLGWGATDSGVMRGTTIPGRAKGYFITELGGRVGKRYAADTAAVMRYAAYEADKSTLVPGTRLGNTNTFSVPQLLADRVSGANYTRPVMSIIAVPKNQPITLSGLGTSADWAHGQDNSGYTMHERTGVGGGLPSEFVSSNSRPEGKLAIWGTAYEDVAPDIPLNTVSPKNGSSTIDDNPTISFDFTSANEVLPGFPLGTADRLTKYQVQLLDSAGGKILQDSGIDTATVDMIADRRVSWTVPDGLAPGKYNVRVQVYNMLGTKSAWVQWTFNVVSAGTIDLTGPEGVVITGTPDIDWSYFHKQGLSMDKLLVRILNSTGTSIVRNDSLYDFSTDPITPSTGTLSWSSTGWDALPPGDYQLVAQALDTDGQPSPLSGATIFHVNAAPKVPIYRTPLPGAVLTAVPELNYQTTDTDNPVTSLTTEVNIRKQGETEFVTLQGTYDTSSRNKWIVRPLIEGAIAPEDHGFWEWQVRATDPHGVSSDWSTWLTFEYTTPPTVSVVEPVGEITVARPHFSWTIDRTQTSFRIQLFDASTGALLDNGDSGWVIGPDTFYDFSLLLLRHEQQVRGRIDVITAGDVPGYAEWEFVVAYTPPASVTGVTVVPEMTDFDYPNTPTGNRLNWDRTLLSDLDFDSYDIWRKTPATGEMIPLVLISDPDETTWLDLTVGASTLVEYHIMQREQNELDLIPSVPTVVSIQTGEIVGVSLYPVIGGGPGITLPYWDSLNVTPQRDIAVRDSWARKPRITVGPMSYNVLSGDIQVLPDPMGRFGIEDLLQDIRTLSDTWLTTAGELRTRVICARLYDGRVFYGMITRADEIDTQRTNTRKVRFEFTEVLFDHGDY